jgi:hypothetical protein
LDRLTILTTPRAEKTLPQIGDTPVLLPSWTRSFALAVESNFSTPFSEMSIGCRNLSLAHFVVGLQDHSQTHPWRKTVDRFANRRIRLSGNQSHILRDRHRGRMGSEALLTAPDNGAVPKMTDGAIPRGSEEVP